MAEKVSKVKAINLKKIAVARKDLNYLNPDDIHFDKKWNERNLDRPEVKAHIEALALSISKIGILQPLTAVTRDGLITLTDGFCRMEAVKIAIKKYKADIKAIPVLLEERGTNDADHTLSMLSRNEGLAFTFSEQARVVKRLLAFKWSKNDIAAKSCRSLTHIDNCIMLLESDPKGEVMKLLDSNKVSARLALEIIRECKAKDKITTVPDMIKKAVVTASEKGKTMATKRTAPKPSAPASVTTTPPATTSATDKADEPEKKIAWAKHGPEFMKLLEELETGFENIKFSQHTPSYISDIVIFYKDYKADNKLEPIKEIEDKK